MDEIWSPSLWIVVEWVLRKFNFIIYNQCGIRSEHLFVVRKRKKKLQNVDHHHWGITFVILWKLLCQSFPDSLNQLISLFFQSYSVLLLLLLINLTNHFYFSLCFQIYWIASLQENCLSFFVICCIRLKQSWLAFVV